MCLNSHEAAKPLIEVTRAPLPWTSRGSRRSAKLSHADAAHAIEIMNTTSASREATPALLSAIITSMSEVPFSTCSEGARVSYAAPAMRASLGHKHRVLAVSALPTFSLLSNAVLPNPSLKLSPNGGPPGPVWRYAVHFRQPGPGVPPSVPA